MALDEEYIDRRPEMVVETNKRKDADYLVKLKYDFDVKEAIRIWYSDSDSLFSKVLPRDSVLLTILNTNTSKQLVLASKNVDFNPLIRKMLMEFVFRGSSELTEGQKDVISDLAL